MSNPRLRILLEAGAQQRLSEAEETELARLLEDPTNRAELDRELTTLKHRFGGLLDYDHARRAQTPAIPEARLEALLASLTGRKAPEASRASPFRRWLGPAAAVGAIAAGLTLVVWYQRPDPQASSGGELRAPSAPPAIASAPAASRSRGVFEYAVMATLGSVRGDSAKTASRLGPDWREVPQQNLAALAAWAAADLPAEVAVRIWVDEEAGKLRARYRRADGNIATDDRPIALDQPTEQQVRSFVEQLTGGR